MDDRPLSGDEARVLRLLLAADAETYETLLGQLPFAHVTRVWIEGLPSIDIELAAGAPKALLQAGVLPVQGDVTNDDGEFTGLILVWVEDGGLAGLEYAWHSDDPPTARPSNERIAVKHRAP